MNHDNLGEGEVCEITLGQVVNQAGEELVQIRLLGFSQGCTLETCTGEPVTMSAGQTLAMVGGLLHLVAHMETVDPNVHEALTIADKLIEAAHDMVHFQDNMTNLWSEIERIQEGQVPPADDTD